MLVQVHEHLAHALAKFGVARVGVLGVDALATLLPLLCDGTIVHSKGVLLPLGGVAQPALRVGGEDVAGELEAMLEIVLLDREGASL